MAASNMNFRFPSVVILLLASFISLLHFNNASDLVSSTCSKIASVHDTQVKRDFCITTLQADPKSASANLTELRDITIRLALKKLTAVVSQLKDEGSNTTDGKIKMDYSCCEQAYSSALMVLNAVPDEIINKKYINDIRNDVTTACSAVDDCNTYCDDIDQSILDKLAKDHEALKALTTMAVDLFDATSV